LLVTNRSVLLIRRTTNTATPAAASNAANKYHHPLGIFLPAWSKAVPRQDTAFRSSQRGRQYIWNRSHANQIGTYRRTRAS